MEDRVVGRDPAAEAEADQVGPIDLERVEQIVVVEDQIVEALEPVGHRRIAEPRVLGRDEIDGLGHPLVERQPHPRRAGAVQEHRRRSGPLPPIGGLQPADVDEVGLRVMGRLTRSRRGRLCHRHPTVRCG
jgi:hypothetical protein